MLGDFEGVRFPQHWGLGGGSVSAVLDSITYVYTEAHRRGTLENSSLLWREQGWGRGRMSAYTEFPDLL